MEHNNYGQITVSSLKNLARERGIMRYSRLNKSEFIKKLREPTPPREPTREELRQLARERGLRGYSRLNKEFNDDDYKVRDHCHFTGRYRGAAHNSCNLKYRKPSFTPVVFHNLSGYDSHLFIKNLGFSEGDIDCIPNNEERYISFTKKIQVGSYTKKVKNEEGETVYETRPLHHQIRFIDSFKFIGYKCRQVS